MYSGRVITILFLEDSNNGFSFYSSYFKIILLVTSCV